MTTVASTKGQLVKLIRSLIAFGNTLGELPRERFLNIKARLVLAFPARVSLARPGSGTRWPVALHRCSSLHKYELRLLNGGLFKSITVRFPPFLCESRVSGTPFGKDAPFPSQGVPFSNRSRPQLLPDVVFGAFATSKTYLLPPRSSCGTSKTARRPAGSPSTSGRRTPPSSGSARAETTWRLTASSRSRSGTSPPPTTPSRYGSSTVAQR